MTIPDLKAFHIGVVVYDIDAAVEGYKRLLGSEHWQIRSFGSGFRTAYGSGGGTTWELLEVKGEGSTQFHEFRDQHGEGIHHVGFWSQDIRASVKAALEEGAKLVWTTTDAEGRRVVQLQPAASVTPEHYSGLNLGAIVDPGFGGWRIEYVDSGETGPKFFKEWLQDEYPDIIVTPPPWAPG
jgi:methylmalonyl-CoA/ethylmalonyl-CoA epimerase